MTALSFKNRPKAAAQSNASHAIPVAQSKAFSLRSSRTFYFLFAILVFAVLTFLAYLQSPRPDPFQPVQTLSWDWWQYPLERNAFKRLPVITSNLNDVFALPNSEKVWAVGDEGMIVHSEDGGEKWVQQKVNWEAVADSQFTQASSEQEQQQVDSTKAFDARQQNAPRSNIAQKGLNPAAKQANALVRTPEARRLATLRTPRLNSVYFVDVEHGWAVGSSGTILKTSNGGVTWQARISETTESLLSVHFANDTTGWTVGEDGTIRATRDGGATWQVQARERMNMLLSVHFVNVTNGWAVGDKGVIFATNDGGHTWTRQKSNTRVRLHSVHFIDANTGWVVGEGLRLMDFATILMTQDGGQTWVAQESRTRQWLLSVNFTDAKTGWAVGSGGEIITTDDGGQTWQTQTNRITRWLKSVHFINSNTGWAVGDYGTILMTNNGGITWKVQASVAPSVLYSVDFVNAMSGWTVSDDGTILMTNNGGVTWQAQASGTENALFSVDFVNANTGCAVGSDGTILVTNNGGVTWQARKSGTTNRLYSVDLVNATTGWAVGVNGTILSTNNGGATWQAQTSGATSGLYSVHFVNASTGWAVGNSGTILSTNNGGVTWQAQTSGTTSRLHSVHFVNATTGWAVDESETILSTNNGGATWQAQTSKTTSLLLSVHFVNATTGWAVGNSGTILSTNNGGATWQVQTSGTKRWLYSVHFVNAGTGWAVGNRVTILSTNNGGQTWKDPTLPYSRSFAPWYYLSLLFLAPLLYLAFKKPKPIEPEQKTVADMLVSDRPIAAGDPDPLEFNAIARGLSRFLRNENTQPPLTIAITGEWGSGKSSLMNLLKADLERYGFRPVWFNAWHHQKEEHLLAALLQNIRKQALPRWWRPEGMSFRARLFWARVRRYRVLALFMLALLSVSIGYFVADTSRISNAWDEAAKFEKDNFGFLFGEKQQKPAAPKAEVDSLLIVKEGEGWRAVVRKGLASSKADSVRDENGDEREQRISLWTFILSAFGSLFVLWRWLRAFGVNPASLMASISDKARMRDLKAQMGFRHDFAKEFSEVTAALNPRTMLILIDDLDRCRPENVLEVLEAVNFLVSSGDCFVVMGLDLTRVERCVGLGFKDVAEELADEVKAEASKDGGKSHREKFARQYLEKLINIEVPVPKPQPEQSQSLIVPPEPIVSKPLPWWQNLLQIITPKVLTIAPWLLAIVVLIAGFWFGIKQFSPKGETPSTTTVAQTSTTPTPSSNQPTPSTTTAQPARLEARADSSRGTGELIQPEKEPTSFAFVYVALALILALAIWRLSIPTDLVVKDSPEFIDALKIWHPLLIAKRNTPRSVKRFVNRVRYFAMRQSTETEAQSVWQRLAVWAGFKEKEEAKQVEAVPESILVALSAIHHAESELIDPTTLANLMTYLEGRRVLGTIELPPNTGIPEELKGVLINSIADSVQKHIERFENWPPSEDDRKRLEKLSAGIRIS